MNYLPRKIDLKDIAQEACETVSEVRVQRSMLDMFGHMNNSQYAILAADALSPDDTYNQVRIEYKQQAKCGDSIFIKRAVCNDRTVICLENEAGAMFAVTEFSNFR
jgi:acyl-ACP thioesterase